MKGCIWRRAKKEVVFMTRDKKNIYILRKDLRIHQEYIEDSDFYYFWNEDNLQREKRGTNYKKFLKKSLDEFKSIIESNNCNLSIINGGIIEKVTSIFEPDQIENIYIQRQYLPWEREEEEYLNNVFLEKLNLFKMVFYLRFLEKF
jgi:deoxyribodipyrimidine photolyase